MNVKQKKKKDNMFKKTIPGKNIHQDLATTMVLTSSLLHETTVWKEKKEFDFPWLHIWDHNSKISKNMKMWHYPHSIQLSSNVTLNTLSWMALLTLTISAKRFRQDQVIGFSMNHTGLPNTARNINRNKSINFNKVECSTWRNVQRECQSKITSS